MIMRFAVVRIRRYAAMGVVFSRCSEFLFALYWLAVKEAARSGQCWKRFKQTPREMLEIAWVLLGCVLRRRFEVARSVRPTHSSEDR
jgi:hypothetical protein